MKQHYILLAFGILLLQAGYVGANPLAITPKIGSDVPLGPSAGAWSPGYTFSLELPVSHRHGLDWSAEFSVQRNEPNGVGLLKTGGRTFKVEHKEGWSAAVEASLLGSGKLTESESGSSWIAASGGVGIFYLKDSDVFVGGFYPTPTSAINRDRFIPGQALVVPGLTLGFSAHFSGIEPTLRLRHLFTADGARDLLFVGVGLLAQ
jgi:hypothetical protein